MYQFSISESYIKVLSNPRNGTQCCFPVKSDQFQFIPLIFEISNPQLDIYSVFDTSNIKIFETLSSIINNTIIETKRTLCIVSLNNIILYNTNETIHIFFDNIEYKNPNIITINDDITHNLIIQNNIEYLNVKFKIPKIRYPKIQFPYNVFREIKSIKDPPNIREIAKPSSLSIKQLKEFIKNNITKENNIIKIIKNTQDLQSRIFEIIKIDNSIPSIYTLYKLIYKTQNIIKEKFIKENIYPTIPKKLKRKSVYDVLTNKEKLDIILSKHIPKPHDKITAHKNKNNDYIFDWPDKLLKENFKFSINEYNNYQIKINNIEQIISYIGLSIYNTIKYELFKYVILPDFELLNILNYKNDNNIKNKYFTDIIKNPDHLYENNDIFILKNNESDIQLN